MTTIKSILLFPVHLVLLLAWVLVLFLIVPVLAALTLGVER